jgi:hypothetical protein
MTAVPIFIGVMILVDVAAWFWGVDSRGLGTDDRRPWI